VNPFINFRQCHFWSPDYTIHSDQWLPTVPTGAVYSENTLLQNNLGSGCRRCSRTPEPLPSFRVQAIFLRTVIRAETDRHSPENDNGWTSAPVALQTQTNYCVVRCHRRWWDSLVECCLRHNDWRGVSQNVSYTGIEQFPEPVAVLVPLRAPFYQETVRSPGELWVKLEAAIGHN
jgi:hypothetical protein